VFTGIVQGIGTVRSVTKGTAVWTFAIELPDTSGLQRGASVAVHGVCLTATEIVGSCVHFDVIPETLERTTLSSLEAGNKVNIERSLKMGDELGGHLLSGHIMATGTVEQRTTVGEGVDLNIGVPAELMKYINEKGYIALNGASLTVGTAIDRTFTVHLIPETLRLTTFGSAQVGDGINIEIDAMTQTVVATVERILKQDG